MKSARISLLDERLAKAVARLERLEEERSSCDDQGQPKLQDQLPAVRVRVPG